MAYKANGLEQYVAQAQQITRLPLDLGTGARLSFVMLDDSILEYYEDW